MRRKNETILERISLGHFVHGGQVIADAPDGVKLFVWGGLPGEIVDVRIIKKKRTYIEGLVVHIHTPSPDRVEPSEPETYLSTSPWQIVRAGAEKQYKDEILREVFKRESIDVFWSEFIAFGGIDGYRNKMEYAFFGDEEGLHLAHFVRGAKTKRITEPYLSPLPMDDVHAAADHVLRFLRQQNVRAGDLKTVVIRASQDHATVVALFVKNKKIRFGEDTPKALKVYYSDPKSPASVPTELLQSFGGTTLIDTVDGHRISYDVLSFFQVNIRIFEQALLTIKSMIESYRTMPGNERLEVVDFYSGVGTIGIVVGAQTLVESDQNNIEMAKQNTKGTEIKVIHAAAEQALSYIHPEQILIVDPPRAGLHKDVIARIREAKPNMVVYLSCDPATQARDVTLLEHEYEITYAQGFNFFPRTPHIESLLVLQLR